MFDIETTGLRPFNCIVTLIGIKREGKIKQWKLWEINKISDSIVGYNNLKFDVPFMLERLRILEKWEESFYEIYMKKWFDLYQYLGNDYRSMTIWSKRANIEREFPDLDGGDMPIYYERGQYEKIVQHNTDDLNTSEKLFNFLKEQNPELMPLR
jgi:uncharacterized protein YprB with RNaseH-like and TPR domain